MARAHADLSLGAGNEETERVAWVAPEDVDILPLHPAFAESWPHLRGLLTEPAVIVDAANVVGSTPDGWWKDRPGAARRMLDRLAAREWWPGADLGYASDSVRPEFHAVLEGQARAGAGAGPRGPITVHHAPGEGDDEIVRLAGELTASGRTVVVVTSDRGLRARLRPPATWVGAGALVRR